MERYVFLEHTADIKFRAWGKTLNEAFENAVLAVGNFLAKGQEIKHRKGKVVNIKGSDKESLFYNLLEEILYLLDSEGFLTVKANVNVLGNTVKAEFFGDDAENYSGLDAIKAPTYAEMYVREVHAGGSSAGGIGGDSGGAGGEGLGGEAGWEVQAVMDV